MYKKITFKAQNKFTGTADDLKEQLEKKIEFHKNESTYSNSEASFLWIIRGCIDYFDKLDSSFLGSGNESGIPNMEADYFAANLYRCSNALRTLGELWNIDFSISEQFKILRDIRTLIVHSGENINKIESLELANYKDSQLGRIFKNTRKDPMERLSTFKDEYFKYDYCLEVWSDKHDKTKKQHMSEVDYHIKNESYSDDSIYLNADDVRNSVFSQIEQFLKSSDENSLQTSRKLLPPIKDKVIKEETEEIDFDKIANLISKNLRGGYMIENEVHHWNGFGLQRVMKYANSRLDLSAETKKIISQRIKGTVSKFWDDYQNSEIPDDDLSSLDVRRVFSDFLPNYEKKHYLEGEKLFLRIAPFFNTRDKDDATDIDYLARFIGAISEALNIQFSLENSVDGLICDYICRSVELSVIQKTFSENKSFEIFIIFLKK